jgi:hypothetical protein
VRSSIQKLIRAVFFGFVILAFALAAGELYASSGSDCTGPGELGPCPPFTDSLCECACDIEFGSIGFCDPESDCCTCAI